MSTIDERKIAFKGTTNKVLQKLTDSYFTTLGGINSQELYYSSSNFYYFMDASGKIIRTFNLPMDYTEKKPEDYFKDSLGGIKNQENKIPEYIECIKSEDNSFTVGKIYTWPNPANDKGTILQITTLDGLLWKFKPSTKQSYDAQEAYFRAAEYTPQVGDYVVMEKAGGWGYSPDNNGCVAIVSRVGKNKVDRNEVFSIWGKVINPNKGVGVEFSDIPQFGYNKEIIFRKALPHEIPGSNVKTEPQQQVAEWSKGTYAVGIKGNFGIYKGSDNLVTVGSIFTIDIDRGDRTVIVKESQFWVYKENLKWFATRSEAVQFSNRLQFEASPTAAVSESPLEICKRKYKKGMLVRSARKYGAYSGEFIIDADPREFTITGGDGVDYFQSKGWLYIDGKFADILEEPLTRENKEFHLELERRTQYPITLENAFPVKAIQKQIKKNKFQEVHEIKTVEEKLLKKTKSKLFNI